jgi:lysine 2,3-aminomutase
MDYLRGYTSGLAIPAYIVNAPEGQGKTPILPKYLLRLDQKSFVFRTWENVRIRYVNHSSIDLREALKKAHDRKQ